MSVFISLIGHLVTLLRIAIAVILGSLGISSILASLSRFFFEPSNADLVTLLIWVAKPLAVGVLFLAIAYWVSITLTRYQKVIILVLVFVLSIILFLMLVSGMSWFSESLALDPSLFGGPMNALQEINNMSRMATGL
ncbi:MAG: hypothetical protein NTV10_04515 [Methanoregula sp.]|jgi:hypothetical protein|nr:hypothetical protein [Methanoregula sp.]